MDIIPLTLGLSLVLSLTFIALFLREFTRPRRAGSDHDSLLPFQPETPAATPAESTRSSHHHSEGERCAGSDPTKPRCSACQRRQARLAAKSAARASTAQPA